MAEPFAGMGAMLAVCVISWIIMAILFILSGLKIKTVFEKTAQHTRVDMFKTSGFVYFIGAILTIIGVGLLIILIAAILMIVAFFALSDSPVPAGMGQPGMPQQQSQGRVCPNCGRPIVLRLSRTADRVREVRHLRRRFEYVRPPQLQE